MLYLKKQNKKIRGQQGSMAILTIVFTSLFITIMGGILSLLIYQNRLAKKLRAKESALQIAEAGVNYYRWHLAHNKDDYADGRTADVCAYPAACGPYTHDYYDPLGAKIGEFELYITPPPENSTVVAIKSTGRLDGSPSQYRIVEVQYGIPSLAAYSFLTNSDAWFRNTENITGPIHSNGGIRMDGTNDSIVSSSVSTYTCASSHGCSPDEEKPGVWGTGSGSGLWQFPVSPIDFNTISLSLSQMQIDSQTSSGVHYPDTGADAKGYRIIFKNNGTFDVYRVDTLKAAVQQRTDNWNVLEWEQIADEPNNQTFLENKPAPANGIIFIEDNVWVEGIVKGRFTLVSAKLTGIPADYTTIRINGNINYLSHDGSDILGLIAEKDIKVPQYAPNVLTIDAILLAQNGRVFYNNYSSPAVKTSIEVYGGIITNKAWTWSWTQNGVTVDGYDQTTSIYNNDAAFSPPPSFPNTGEYNFISWKEKVAGEL
ncbi:MAG: hypothetical protein V1688_00120 [bacterium]